MLVALSSVLVLIGAVGLRWEWFKQLYYLASDLSSLKWQAPLYTERLGAASVFRRRGMLIPYCNASYE